MSQCADNEIPRYLGTLYKLEILFTYHCMNIMRSYPTLGPGSNVTRAVYVTANSNMLAGLDCGIY